MLGGCVAEHRNDRPHRLLEDLALLLHVDAERLELGDRGAFSHAELAATVRQQVEGGSALGDPRRMVGGELDDAVAKPDLPGPLAGRGKERFRGRRMGILLEEVMLDLPGMVVAQPVSELDLRQGILVEPVLVPRLPGPG